MAEENGQVAGMSAAPGKQWAVICTGFIDGRGFPTLIQTAKQKSAPVVIKLCADQSEAERMMTRLRNRHSKVKMFGDPDLAVTTPIYGVTETDLDVPRKRIGNPNAFGRGKPEAEAKSVPNPDARKGKKQADTGSTARR